MFHYIMVLKESEYQLIQSKRQEARWKKQREAEQKYNYSKEKTQELLSQRNVEQELKSLKHRQWGYFSALVMAGAILWGAGAMAQRKSEKGSLALRGAALVTLCSSFICLKKMTKKVLNKKDELFYAKNGMIDPRLELLRQEGLTYN